MYSSVKIVAMELKPVIVLAMICGCVHGKSLLHEAVDLTYSTKEGELVSAPMENVSPSFKHVIANRGQFENNGEQYYMENNHFSQGEHIGTHMDAPSHFGIGKWRLHEIPFERLAGDAVVINITEKASKDPDTTVDVSDLEAWEKEYGQIPDGAVIVMYSGWGEKYSKNPEKYFGATIDKLQSLGPDEFWSTLHFPGFGIEAARWLVENRRIHGIISDTMSLDCGQCGFKTHKVILNNNIWGIENTANVHKLRPAGDMVFAVPYKIHDGSGGPVRVFALPSATYAASVGLTAGSNFVYISLFIITVLLVLHQTFNRL